MKNDTTTYESLKSQFHTGDLIVFAGSGIVSGAIRLFTEFSHVETVIRLLDYEGEEKRRFIIGADRGGIQVQLLSNVLESYDGEIYWYPLCDDLDPARRYLGTWAFSQLGKSYDYAGLFKNALGRVSEDADAFFCSEFAFMALRTGCDMARICEDLKRDIYLKVYADWDAIERKAAWPGDIKKFTNCYRFGGKLV